MLNAGYPDGAYYPAGYSVECGLKACIAKGVQRYDFPDKRSVEVVTRTILKSWYGWPIWKPLEIPGTGTLMDKTALVTADFATGAKILEALDHSGLAISVAMWVYLVEYDDWRFVHDAFKQAGSLLSLFRTIVSSAFCWAATRAVIAVSACRRRSTSFDSITNFVESPVSRRGNSLL